MGTAARLALIVNLVKAAWAVIGWFGLSATMIGAAITVWGGIEAVALGTPWPIAIMAGFCVLVATAYLVLTPMAFRLVRGALPPPFVDHAAWTGHQEYRITDAACLFAGVATVATVRPDHPAWAWYAALSDAVRMRQIEIEDAAVFDSRGAPVAGSWTNISAEQLRDFAESKGVRPRFLFPQ